MPKNEVADTITDQEIAFACLILSGTMTDERAAEAVGLNPATAAYIKSKPCVRAYLLEQQARMQQKLVAQQTESLPRFHLGREKVLDRLPRKRSSFCKPCSKGISLLAPYRLLQTNPFGKAHVLRIHLSVLAVLVNVRWIPRLSTHLPLAFIVAPLELLYAKGTSPGRIAR